MRSAVQWRLCWENSLQVADHVELSDFFRKIYGRNGVFGAKPFEGGRSWAGARPELRLIASDPEGVAAHIGILRRFIKVGDVDVLVAELGLYGVRQDLEKLGISFSMRAVYPVLQQMGVPFAFGTVRHAMRNHVERYCREGIATIVPGVRVRSSRANVHHDLPSTRLDDVLVLVSPIGRSMDEWPSGTLIDRNGPEL
ncbi:MULTISPECIES: NodA family N-acyltransferase [Mesorhizobium]|uniref:NodA family N-acyltransferase n=1 Tax=Mesorhizobium TaxID=68287 RepID=UPI0007ED64EF|nr:MULTISPECIES: NodA family N-acyltransferase [Mesorhizobium]TPJ43727.1 NodA family N-acyltransferase [Mesorhizobium sp. B2-6-6]ARP67352.1 acyltransferase [Mesorhizobium sp. WSM1497]MCA0002916.1 NodA family N-acyltransferase [Mesorhizobium sp. B264B2A]MCA0009202.1 NodA family N-acyltransferase [Mesorhizobium sp. B264B1B]MCA0013997.1 NodA family N-acyltransferase [Mesorhizobium sp. B294B1A1]